MIAGAETCDQGGGNVTPGDGCSATCTGEIGWTCTGTPSTCVTTCGDTFLAGTEQCDDGGILPGDGCSATCTLECGNGTLGANEQCDDGGRVNGDGCSASCTFEVSCAAGETLVQIHSTDVPKAIPDNTPAGISSNAVVPAGTLGAVRKVSVGIGSLTHSYIGDIALSLASPSTKRRSLMLNRGAEGDNLVRTRFEDTAASSITAVVAANAPFIGVFRPEQTLSDAAGYLGENAVGTWSLRAIDSATDDTGSIINWTLSMCVNPTAACGNGILDLGEECDTSGASATCTATCQQIDGCGDGNLDAGEFCDDDNVTSGDGCSATCQPDITCAAGQTPVVLFNNTSVAIPDNNTTGVSSPIAVATAGAVKKVQVTVGSLTHANTQHVDLSLVSPATTTRNVSDDNNTSTVGANYRGTTLADTATTLVTATAQLNPYTGLFRPEATLSTTAGTDFLNQNALGTWNLRAVDDTTATTGTLDSWALGLCLDTVTFCGNGVTDVGEECDTAGASATCSATCRLLDGCGDGNLDVGESCDDDNLVSGDGCSSTCQLEITCAAGETLVTGANSATFAIPDGNPTGISSPITLAVPGAVTKVVAVINNVTHSANVDVDMFLIGPSSLNRELSTDQSGANYISTYFDDTATTAITAGSSPYTGRFRPEATISSTVGTDFRAQNGAGTWTLQVIDDAAVAVGSLNGWSLALCVNPTAAYCGDGIVQATEECDTMGASVTCSGSCQLLDGCGDGNIDAGEFCDDNNVANGDGCSAACQLEITCAPGQLAVTGINSTSFAIPDNNPTGISSPITLATPGAVTKVVAAVNSLTHGFNVDVDMFLIGPGGLNRELSTDQSGANYSSTYFDDAAATLITAGSAPYSGRFRPETTISTTTGTDFRSQNGAGSWILRVIDDASGGVGTLNSWSLALCVDPAAPYCGDGLVQATEECDTMGASATCSGSCQLLDGCGDGNIDAGEYCDDNNVASGDGCSATCQPDITCAVGQTPVVLFNNTSVAIPDNNTTGVSSSIVVATAGSVKKVQVTVGSVTHANTQHVDLSLISPATTTRNVSDDNNTSTVGANYRGTVFADAATTLVTATAQLNPYTGLFRPEATLSTTVGTDFLNQNALGTWNLRAVDDTTATTGTLDSWALALCLDTVTFCGNGVIDAGEECDTSGPTATCSAACQLLDGCGDGNIDAGELCDDNNIVSGDGCSSTCQPDITCAAGETPVILSNTTAVAIPDTNSGAISLITQPTPGVVRKVIPTINITHPAAGDLDIVLVSPVGPQRNLSDDNGAGANYVATTFSDTATTAITAGAAPFTGTFLPEETLSNAAGFGGVSGAGAWALKVGDDTTTNTGTINRWTLALCIDTTVTAVCGNGFVEAAETCDDGNTTAGDGCSTTCQVELSCPVGQLPVLVTSTNALTIIPDGDTATGVTTPIAIAATGTVRSAVAVLNSLPHAFGGDLDIYLQSPLGTQRALTLDISGANFFSTMFSDAAAAALPATAGHRGRFRPAQTISGASPGSGFAGEGSAGIWNLRTFDDDPIGVGLLGRWTLGLCVE